MQDFEDIYSTYYGQIYGFLMKLCQDEMLAEELTQETFFKVIKKIESYRGDCKLSVWICQIAKNTYYTYLKKNDKLTDYPIEELSDENSFEQKLVNKEVALQIHEILHRLKEPYKEVFWMKTFGELSFAQIGKVHGKTESWARVTYHRAKIMIKEELE